MEGILHYLDTIFSLPRPMGKHCLLLSVSGNAVLSYIITLFVNVNRVNPVPICFPSLLWPLGIAEPNLYPTPRDFPGPQFVISLLVYYVHSLLDYSLPIFSFGPDSQSLFILFLPSFIIPSLVSYGMRC